jgi:DNA-binding transcriptional ArsR family regulator
VSDREQIAEALLARVAERFSVLGQVVRLRLVEELADGSATPQELADRLGLTQQNVSKHLQILHRNGLVGRRQDGANAIYSLKDASVVRMVDDAVTSVTTHLRGMAALAGGDGEGRLEDGGARPGRG